MTEQDKTKQLNKYIKQHLEKGMEWEKAVYFALRYTLEDEREYIKSGVLHDV